MDNPWSRGINSFFSQYTPAALQKHRESLEQEGIQKFFSGTKADEPFEKMYERSQTTPGLSPEKGSRIINAMEDIKSKRKVYEKRESDAALSQDIIARAKDGKTEPVELAADLAKLDKNAFDQTTKTLAVINPKFAALTPYQQQSIDVRNNQLNDRKTGPETVRKFVDSIFKGDMEVNPNVDEKSWMYKRIEQAVNDPQQPMGLAEATDAALVELQERRDMIENADIQQPGYFGGSDNDLKVAAMQLGQLMNALGYTTKAQFARLARENGWKGKKEIDQMYEIARQPRDKAKEIMENPLPGKKTVEEAEAFLYGG